MILARRAMLLMLLAAGSVAAADPATSLRHVAKGVTSGATDGNAFMVLRTADDLAAALKLAGSRAAGGGAGDVAPAVDFDHELVVGVLLSNRPTGCAGVDITAIAQDGIVSVVHFRERKPGKGQACEDTPYSPFDFVAAPKTNAPFRFTQDDEP